MTPIYATQPFLKPIFLWSPGAPLVPLPMWCNVALDRLKMLGFGGIVFVPEEAPDALPVDVSVFSEWEYAALSQSGAILVWVSDEMLNSPDFAGRLDRLVGIFGSKVLIGYPAEAAHLPAFCALAQSPAPRLDSLDALLSAAVVQAAASLAQPAPRAPSALVRANAALSGLAALEGVPSPDKTTTDLSVLTPEQLAIFAPWADLRQPLRGAAGRFEVSTVYTGIGVSCRVKCLVTGDKLDLTDYDRW